MTQTIFLKKSFDSSDGFQQNLKDICIFSLFFFEKKKQKTFHTGIVVNLLQFFVECFCKKCYF